MNIENNLALRNKALAAFQHNQTELAQLRSDIMLLQKHNKKVFYGIPSIHMVLGVKRGTGYFHVINKHNVSVDIILTHENELFVNKVKFAALESALKFADSIQSNTLSKKAKGSISKTKHISKKGK